MVRRNEAEEEATDIVVKVGQTGSAVVEIILNGERTVADALRAANLEVSSSSRLRVGGVEAQLTDELEDGDILVVAGSIKGGL